MSEESLEEEPPKKSKKPVLIGVVLMLVLGASGFFAVYSNTLLPAAPAAPEAEEMVDEPVEEAEPIPKIAFVALDPLIINLLAQDGRKMHLRFRAHIEVPEKYEADVTGLQPRLTDVLNTYLRAVEVEKLENPSSLTRIRAQILRRLQVVAGYERVNDVLIMEFVIN